MKPIKVESSTIDTLELEGTTLTVTFKHSPKVKYVYEGVLKEEFADMITADSIGHYFAEVIKPHHTWKKVED